MTIHELKTWPSYFREIAEGNKTFEYRVNDRDFKVGDQVRLREYEMTRLEIPEEGRYTGRHITARIGYILLLAGTDRCVFSLLDIQPGDRWLTDVEFGRGRGVEQTALQVLEILDSNAPAKEILLAVRKYCTEVTK